MTHDERFTVFIIVLGLVLLLIIRFTMQCPEEGYSPCRDPYAMPVRCEHGDLTALYNSGVTEYSILPDHQWAKEGVIP